MKLIGSVNASKTDNGFVLYIASKVLLCSAASTHQ